MNAIPLPGVCRLFVSLILIGSAWAQQPPAQQSAHPAQLSGQTDPAAERKPEPLRDLSASLVTLTRRVSRSVVQIFSTGYSIGEAGEGGANSALVTRQLATGSGVILTADGYIVTNRHVVENARRVRVRVAAPDTASPSRSTPRPAGKLLEARIVGVDRDTDLAVLKVEQTGLPHLTLGDSDNLRQGQIVMAFGNPLGLENSVSMGVVSSVARQIRTDDSMVYIQTDAPINPGNSGGPLVDVEGRVMGINTFILSQSGGSEGLGFAIPSNTIRSVYTQIKQAGHVHRSEIGVSAQTITPALAAGLRLPQDWGVLLADVTPDGPADKAGLQVGDIVLALNGRPIDSVRQLEVAVLRAAVGETLKVQVLRDGARLTYEAAAEEREDDPQRFADMVDPVKNMIPKLGILGIEVDRKVSELLPDLRKKYGVAVAALAGGASYTGDSLSLGDVIYSVNTEPVTSVEALRTALDNLKDAEPLVLQVERSGRLIFVTMENE